MERERYGVMEDEDGLNYSFYSVGPKRRTRKKVRFQPVKKLGNNVHNLLFGEGKLRFTYETVSDGYIVSLVKNQRSI
jgi:hypothetical protein